MGRRWRRTGAVAAGLLLLAVLAWYLGPRAGPDRDEPMATLRPGSVDAVQHGPAGSSGEPAGATGEPLPSLDIPFGQTYKQLKHRADGGDGYAACRLAAELEQCAQWAANAAHLPEKDRNRSGEPVQENGVAQQSGHFEEQLRHCEGAPAAGASARARYWRQAALAGHLPAMRHYAIGNAFRFRDLLDALPELALYRDEAERIARRAATAGDAQTAYALGIAYSRGGTQRYRPFLAQVVEPDHGQALMWFLALRNHPDMVALPEDHSARATMEVEIAALLAELPVARAAAAEREAARQIAGWRARPPTRAPLWIHPNGGLPDVGPGECAPPEASGRPE